MLFSSCGPEELYPLDGFVPSDQFPTEDSYPGLKVRVMGLSDARWYCPTDDQVCISISHDTTKVPLDEKFADVLYLKFDDTAFQDMAGQWSNEVNGKSISSKQAQQVAEFVTKYKDKQWLIIHCFAGISRSRSMAAAIANVLELPYRFTVVNKHVYNRVARTLARVE